MLPLFISLVFFRFETCLAAPDCPSVLSCSPGALKADACCVPTRGLLVFRQRFEPDVGDDDGRWGVDGLEVLEWVLPPLLESLNRSP